MADIPQSPEARFRLDNQVVVVTGASSGLGAHFAKLLAQVGATVVATARRATRLEELAQKSQQIHGVTADVTSRPDMARVVDLVVAKFGRVDILVNNAGAINVSPTELEDDQDFQRIISVNLFGPYLASKLVAPHMLEAGKGSIINVVSILGLVGCGRIPQASYAASKGGLVNLTRELAAQWASRNVRVNALAPGWFPSEMTSEMLSSESGRQWIERNTPMKRTGDLKELDGALLLLASDAGSYITGQTLTVDGGWTAI